MAQLTRTEQVLELAREKGMLRPRDLEAHGIPRVYLQVLYKRGDLLRTGRGIYTLTSDHWTEHHTLAEVCKWIPHGVICLLSALRFHDLTTQDPNQVWIAISPRKHRPRMDYPPVRVVRFSGAALAEGVDIHPVEGVSIRVFNPAKTVADCFKYRNKIGLDVALEALRDGWRKRLCTMDDLWRYAQVCRVANVMRPYLESLL